MLHFKELDKAFLEVCAVDPDSIEETGKSFEMLSAIKFAGTSCDDGEVETSKEVADIF